MSCKPGASRVRENDPLDEPKKMQKKVISFQEDSQKRKMVIKSEFTPLSDCKIVPFFKGFKNTTTLVSAE